MAIQNIDQYIETLPKSRREWLEVFGNQWGEPAKVMPGTCFACVWGDGEHAAGCERVTRMDPVKLQGILNAYQNGQIEIK